MVIDNQDVHNNSINSGFSRRRVFHRRVIPFDSPDNGDQAIDLACNRIQRVGLTHLLFSARGGLRDRSKSIEPAGALQLMYDFPQVLKLLLTEQLDQSVDLLRQMPD